jgi:c-di-GMP-binding flagellar brake protein YcgR
MKERRRTSRMQEESSVTITVVSEGRHRKVVYESSKDISVYGAKILSRDSFPVDTLLEIDFATKMMDEKIKTLGKVKWIKVIIEDNTYEIGVEFVKRTGEAIKKLEDYIAWKKKRISLKPYDAPL